jgi:hypothetical protein
MRSTMNAKMICTGILALAASSSAFAGPTETCIGALARDPQLQALAGKVALARSSQAALVRVADRVANGEERAVAALWLEKRQQCFEAGARQRRARSSPQEIAFLRSVFVFEQRLVAELQGGLVTYSEFNQRRLELAQAAGEEI